MNLSCADAYLIGCFWFGHLQESGVSEGLASFELLESAICNSYQEPFVVWGTYCLIDRLQKRFYFFPYALNCYILLFNLEFGFIL